MRSPITCSEAHGGEAPAPNRSGEACTSEARRGRSTCVAKHMGTCPVLPRSRHTDMSPCALILTVCAYPDHVRLSSPHALILTTCAHPYHAVLILTTCAHPHHMCFILTTLCPSRAERTRVTCPCADCAAHDARTSEARRGLSACVAKPTHGTVTTCAHSDRTALLPG